MCGRFSLSTPPEIVAKLFDLGVIPRLPPRYNISPTQSVAVVRTMAERGVDKQASAKATRQLDLLHWGLIPHWAEDPAVGNRMINAKAETAATKPAFRDAFKKRRCLVPADGFYEWKKLDPAGKVKQPYRIARPDGQPFALAGLWTYWRDPVVPKSDGIASFTILTTEPNAITKPIHNRMPAIIQPADFAAWLDPELQDVEQVKSLIKPTPDDELTAITVSRHVNSPKNDDPACFEPADESAASPSTSTRPGRAKPTSSVKPKRSPGQTTERGGESTLFD